MSAHILVVEDDPSMSAMLALFLQQAGYQVSECADGALAADIFSEVKPDLILLDLMLPGKNGIEVCREIRRTSGTPIVMLTAVSGDDQVVVGLEAGADDYLQKPYNPDVLIARIRARLRPLPATADVNGEQLRIGDLTVDIAAHEVRRGESLISLTPLEFSLLATLAAKPSQVFTRDMLLEEVWGYQYKADTRLVNVHVQRLRSKVEHDPDDPQIVATVRGVGYRAGAVSHHS